MKVWGVNDYGDAVGDNNGQGILYSGGVSTTITYPSKYTELRGINNQGQIVGVYATYNGFLYDQGSFQQLVIAGAYSTIPRDINDSGVVVGYFQESDPNRFRGFMYDGEFTTIDYPAVAGTYTFLTGINNNGDIVGYAHIGGGASGDWESFVATPSVNIAPTATNVEASTIVGVATSWTPIVSDPDNAPSSLTCSIVSQSPAGEGTATVAADCSSGTYDPETFGGSATSFTYKANDGGRDSNTATVFITIRGDSDSDGLLDDVEDSNGNGVIDAGETDPFNPDSDGDGLTDGFEVNFIATDPNSQTTVYTLRCDMNEDDDVNLGDLLLLQRQLLGY